MADVDRVPRTGCKRLHVPEEWTRNKEKKLGDAGLEHTDYKSTKVDKKGRARLLCHCDNKCPKKITSEKSSRSWKAFYDLADYSKQSGYLQGLIDVVPGKKW